MAKAKTPTDEKFEKVDFDLFEALAAIDRKDYGYYDRLTDEQKKKFTPFMLIKWLSAISGNSKIQSYYIIAANDLANKHLFNETVMKHPKLQWLMLCTVGLGTKQFHQWIPQIKEAVVKLKEKPKLDDIIEYYNKVYKKTDKALIKEFGEQFVKEYTRKQFIASEYPEMNMDEIEVLNAIISDKDIKQYEEQKGI
jgi:hypothetical protein